jgi:hypothetical protein
VKDGLNSRDNLSKKGSKVFQANYYDWMEKKIYGENEMN